MGNNTKKVPQSVCTLLRHSLSNSEWQSIFSDHKNKDTQIIYCLLRADQKRTYGKWRFFGSICPFDVFLVEQIMGWHGLGESSTGVVRIGVKRACMFQLWQPFAKQQKQQKTSLFLTNYCLFVLVFSLGPTLHSLIVHAGWHSRQTVGLALCSAFQWLSRSLIFSWDSI
mmetsp:Transcript_26684/g.62062  ORF Transcript_26684/g.62062 Transcript_26684/m.62062 type:complete len:169 (+) Transcript_26684:368-874(+)